MDLNPSCNKKRLYIHLRLYLLFGFIFRLLLDLFIVLFERRNMMIFISFYVSTFFIRRCFDSRILPTSELVLRALTQMHEWC
jgi:hypothetical protein